jgi:hypothetical protein
LAHQELTVHQVLQVLQVQTDQVVLLEIVVKAPHQAQVEVQVLLELQV